MKPNRDAEALAARLTAAAQTPLPIPPTPTITPLTGNTTKTVLADEMPADAPPKALRRAREPAKAKSTEQTVQMTLRPTKSLLQRYTRAAAERMAKEGRSFTAQQLMLERLEKGP